ncbi:MAG TPA: hypothetical protein VF719_03805 [Abditibacteriaceae bacterium]
MGSMLVARILVWAVQEYVRRLKSFSIDEKQDYFGIIKLNLVLSGLGFFLYDYCTTDYIWLANVKQRYNFFEQLGIFEAWRIAIAKYLICSLVVLGWALLIFAINLVLLRFAKIPQPKKRAVCLTLLCAFVHLSASAYGCWVFYADRMNL